MMAVTRYKPYTCDPSLTNKHNLIQSLNVSKHLSINLSTLSRNQSSRDWWCLDVSGNLASAQYATAEVLADTASAICASTSSLDAVRAATAAARTMRRS